MVPAMAVPSDEPRLEMQRDKPGDLALLLVGERRLHDVDRRREHRAETESDEQESGCERPRAGRCLLTSARRTTMPTIVATKPVTIERSLRVLLGEPLGGERRHEDAAGGGGEDHAGLDGVVAADDLEVRRDDERRAHEQQPLHVLGDEPEVRGAVAEQLQSTAAVPARDVRAARTWTKNRRGRRRRRRAAPPSSAEVVVGGEDADDDQTRDRRRTARRPRCRRGGSGSGGTGSTIARLSKTMTAMTSAWNTNAARQLIAVVMRPPISGPAAAPMPPMPLMTPNARAREVTSVKSIVVRM